MDIDTRNEQIKDLPGKPGIYKFYNSQKQLIYVGKAKNLKKRVTSYFQKTSGLSRKTQRLISEIARIEVAIVDSEVDALLLENTLIKENQPRYNILLKDDKTFPFICVSSERFPRIYSTRKRISGSDTYFGPYTSVRAMNIVIELLRNLYHIRTCKYNLSPGNIENGQFKVCLEYHLGKCKGPCIGLQTEDEYNEEIKQAINVLKSEIYPVRRYFRDKMKEASSDMQYELAEEIKQKLLLLEKFQTKTVIVNPNYSDIDVFAITSNDTHAFIYYLKIKNGAINLTRTIEVKKRLNESDKDILVLWIVEIRKTYQSDSGEILINTDIDDNLDVPVHVPQRGDKKKLVDLALKNVLYAKKEKSTLTSGKSLETRAVGFLQKDLKLKDLPVHIECFDNSNISGTNPVASMVFFRNGKPLKSNYRKYKIKTVEGPDDFASMKEVIYRRYKRIMDEKGTLPNLIVIDGGKGQLNAATEALRDLELYGSIPIIGIAKRLEEIYVPDDELPIYIDKKSPGLKLIQQIRNEAHRFAIFFHRDRRSKNLVTSELDTIKGIGEKTKVRLLQHFNSIKKVRQASLEELSHVIGKSKATIIISALQKKEVSDR